jgi:hypothetical protein
VLLEFFLPDDNTMGLTAKKLVWLAALTLKSDAHWRVRMLFNDLKFATKFDRHQPFDSGFGVVLNRIMPYSVV